MPEGATSNRLALGFDFGTKRIGVASGDTLTMIIYYGGFLAHLCTGPLYFLAVALGYSQPDVAGHVHDYGAKFLVGAGLLNILAMVDAWEIATGKKS